MLQKAKLKSANNTFFNSNSSLTNYLHKLCEIVSGLLTLQDKVSIKITHLYHQGKATKFRLVIQWTG